VTERAERNLRAVTAGGGVVGVENDGEVAAERGGGAGAEREIAPGGRKSVS
jgi:hypothetical protein